MMKSCKIKINLFLDCNLINVYMVYTHSRAFMKCGLPLHICDVFHVHSLLQSVAHSTQRRSSRSSWTGVGFFTFPMRPHKYIHFVLDLEGTRSIGRVHKTLGSRDPGSWGRILKVRKVWKIVYFDQLFD